MIKYITEKERELVKAGMLMFRIILFLSLILGLTIFVYAEDASKLREQSIPELVEVEVKYKPVPQISQRRRKYYLKIVLRDVLTENDCKSLIDLNQTISLIEKSYKERRYERATDLLKIISDDIDKIKQEANGRIDDRLIKGWQINDFKNLYRNIKRRRYPSTCAYHHLHNIEDDVKVYKRDVEKAIFKQEARLLDKEREVKMRKHIEEALGLLEEKKYDDGKFELKLALELCDEYETKKIIKQRINEVDATIKYEKRQQAIMRKKKK